MTNESKGKRIMYYYQTLTDLSSVLIENTPVTHIILSSYHFGTNPDKTPYIHLNNKPPYDPSFNHVWDQLEIAKQKYGISIHIMLGGAGGAFTDLFNDFETYYPMLIKTILATAGKVGVVDADKKIYNVDLDKNTKTVYRKLKTLIKRYGVFRTYSYEKARKSQVFLEDLRLPQDFVKELIGEN